MHPLIANWITIYLDPAINEARGIQPALMPELAPNRKNQLAALKHLKWVLTQDRFQPHFEAYLRLYREKDRRAAAFAIYEVSEMLDCVQDDFEQELNDYTWAENKRSIFTDIAHMKRAEHSLVSQFGSQIGAERRGME